METRFQNELGHEVRILVERDGDEVHVEMEGPTSIATNDVTVLEARMLGSMLAAVMGG